MTGPHRCQASAASSHCARVVALYCCGSNVVVIGASRDRQCDTGTRQNGTVASRQKRGWHSAPGTGQRSARSAAGSGAVRLRDNAGVPAFVGRAEPLARLTAAYAGRWPPRRCASGRAGAGAGHRRGRHRQDGAADPVRRRRRRRGATRGVGHLLGRRPGAGVVAVDAGAAGAARPARATCADAAPPELAAIVPELAAGPRRGRVPTTRAGSGCSTRPGSCCAGAAARRPVVVILDDLHWADPSTVDLHAVRGAPAPAGRAAAGRRLPAATSRAPTSPPPWPTWPPPPNWCRCTGCRRGEVADLVRAVAGPGARRSSGPRWCTNAAAATRSTPASCATCSPTDRAAADVPAAVREVIGRRLARLSAGCAALLDAAAVAGNHAAARRAGRRDRRTTRPGSPR